MQHFGARGSMAAEAGLVARPGVGLGMVAHNVYRFECRDAAGNLRWVEEVDNLVTTAGLNDALDKYFKGSNYSATWFVGLISGATPTLVAGDTMSSHAGWTEFTSYSEGARQALTLGTPSGGSVNNSVSKATFSISGSGTVGGGFVVSDSTKSGTTGTLYGEAAFGTARSVASGDTISVTATLTLASA